MLHAVVAATALIPVSLHIGRRRRRFVVCDRHSSRHNRLEPERATGRVRAAIAPQAPCHHGFQAKFQMLRFSDALLNQPTIFNDRSRPPSASPRTAGVRSECHGVDVKGIASVACRQLAIEPFSSNLFIQLSDRPTVTVAKRQTPPGDRHHIHGRVAATGFDCRLSSRPGCPKSQRQQSLRICRPRARRPRRHPSGARAPASEAGRDGAAGGRSGEEMPAGRNLR